MNEREARFQPTPGYSADDVWYPYTNESLGQEDRRAEDTAAAVSVAMYELGLARSELSAVQSLLYVVRVSSVVQEGVLQLCQGSTALMEAICSNRETLSGRARAGVSRDGRASRRQVQR